MGKEGGGEEEAAEMTSSARPTLLAMDTILTLLVLIAPGLLHPKTIVEGCLYLNGNGLLWSEHNWLLWSESVMGYYGACMMGYYGLMVYGSYDQVAIQAAM